MSEYEHPPHEWYYCSQCERWTVVCGQCGNNSCNGGTGEVMGPEPGTTMPCSACESAYQMDMNERPTEQEKQAWLAKFDSPATSSPSPAKEPQ